MSVRHSILGLMADGPVVAYQMKKSFDALTSGLWPLNDGQVYTTLQRLQRDGLVAEIAEGEAALADWLDCLEAGDCMAHFALGYTLYDLGRYHEAYRHLRYYAELAPAGPWNWCWYGKAAEAIGEYGEAQTAYRRAIAIERDQVAEGAETFQDGFAVTAAAEGDVHIDAIRPDVQSFETGL